MSRSSAFILLVAASLPGTARAEGLSRDAVEKVAPGPGLSKVARLAPTWCDDIDADSDPPHAFGALGRAIGNDYLDTTIDVAVKAVCAAPDDPVMQEQLASYVQRWVNATGETPAEILGYLAAHAHPDVWEKQKDEACARTAVSEEASPREATFARMSRGVLGCNGGDLLSDDHELWQMDRTAAPPSQLLLVHLVRSCVRSADVTDLWTVARYATCRADAKQLDQAKLVAELAGASEFTRVTAIQELATTRYKASQLEKALQAKVGSDDELRGLLLDTPERAWKAWQAEYDANKAIFDEVYAYEDRFHGARRSAAKGCLAPAYAAFKGYLAKQKASTTEEVVAAATSYTGGALLAYVWSCNQIEGREMATSMTEQLIKAGLPRRGPRFAAAVAMGEVLSRIVADRPKFPITGAMIGADFEADVPTGRSQADWSAHEAGTVAKVSPKGDKVLVSFKTETWQEDEMICQETNRIAMFSGDGTPIYQRNCRGTGRKVTRSSTSEPFLTWPELTDGISAGTFVRYNTGADREDNVFIGVPLEVWKSKDAKALVALLGVKAR